MVAEARPMTLLEREPALRALWKSRRGLHRRLGQAPEAQAAYRNKKFGCVSNLGAAKRLRVRTKIQTENTNEGGGLCNS